MQEEAFDGTGSNWLCNREGCAPCRRVQMDPNHRNGELRLHSARHSHFISPCMYVSTHPRHVYMEGNW